MHVCCSTKVTSLVSKVASNLRVSSHSLDLMAFGFTILTTCFTFYYNVRLSVNYCIQIFCVASFVTNVR